MSRNRNQAARENRVRVSQVMLTPQIIAQLMRMQSTHQRRDEVSRYTASLTTVGVMPSAKYSVDKMVTANRLRCFAKPAAVKKTSQPCTDWLKPLTGCHVIDMPLPCLTLLAAIV